MRSAASRFVGGWSRTPTPAISATACTGTTGVTVAGSARPAVCGADGFCEVEAPHDHDDRDQTQGRGNPVPRGRSRSPFLSANWMIGHAGTVAAAARTVSRSGCPGPDGALGADGRHCAGAARIPGRGIVACNLAGAALSALWAPPALVIALAALPAVGVRGPRGLYPARPPRAGSRRHRLGGGSWLLLIRSCFCGLRSAPLDLLSGRWSARHGWYCCRSRWLGPRRRLAA